MKRLILGLALSQLLVAAAPAAAQLDGARVQWPLPKNMNVVSLHVLSGTANASLTNVHQIQPSLDITNKLYLLGWTRSQPVFGRTAVFSAMLPAGVIQTSSSLPATATDPFVHGIGDPSLSATINLFGAPGLMLREYLRYDLRSTVGFGVSASFPLGQYEASEPLNIGSNQNKVRFSLPMVQSFADWVPGERTTLEVVPSYTWLSTNDDAQGQSIDQGGMWAVETHLSRDITRNAFISADYTYIRFGEATRTSNTTGTVVGTTPAADAHMIGGTVSFQLNDNLGAYVTHMQTVSTDTGVPVTLEGALFRVSLTWSFHRVIERRRTFTGS
jgi:hypothetical protein